MSARKDIIQAAATAAVLASRVRIVSSAGCLTDAQTEKLEEAHRKMHDIQKTLEDVAMELPFPYDFGGLLGGNKSLFGQADILGTNQQPYKID